MFLFLKKNKITRREGRARFEFTQESFNSFCTITPVRLQNTSAPPPKIQDLKTNKPFCNWEMGRKTSYCGIILKKKNHFPEYFLKTYLLFIYLFILQSSTITQFA